MKDIPYWIALSMLPRWKRARINEMIVKFHHDRKITIEDFFHLDENLWRSSYGLETSEIFDLKKAKSDLGGYAFLAEDLLHQGFEVIPIISSDYSPTLKANLKATHSPVILYVKGNKQIMKENTLAIVGSRNASDISLQFTDNIAKLASKEYKVVVSGFAKGIDKQALDSAIKYTGQSIIVLPQGVLTFTTGYKTYYSQIVEGDVLVLSIFFPKAPWKAELAMARNPIIYGLSKEIYVAESSDKGGTWSGVIDGLRKNRTIYVRQPEIGENNANNFLISKGATPVDFNGICIEKNYTISFEDKPSIVQERESNIDQEIQKILNGNRLTTKEIIKRLELDWTSAKLTNYLKKLNFILTIKIGKTNHYGIKGDDNVTQKTLFELS